jgi:DNA repair exonuclease SbcCD nuclease subunit
MPRILHSGDLHLGAHRRLKIPFASKMKRYKGILTFIFLTARKEKVDYIVISGDIFDHKDPHPKVKDLFLSGRILRHTISPPPLYRG